MEQLPDYNMEPPEYRDEDDCGVCDDGSCDDCEDDGCDMCKQSKGCSCDEQYRNWKERYDE